ncbi:MAG: phosphatidate cytidylyltransferase [Proteobacteria bacterium]|nr:phosphatidate cytidylyltransferase [Pseudomonadota bacterium]
MARQPKFQTSSNLKNRLISAAILIPISLYIIYLGSPYALILGGCITIALVMEWIFFCLKNRLSFWKKTIFIILGTFYLSLALFWIFSHLLLPEGWKIIFWLLFLVWSTDTAAYAGGRLLRGPKLAPSISPNKTWSGFVTGMVGGILVGYYTAFWLFPDVQNGIIIGLLVLIAQGGDLLESVAKRWAQIKDSSALIPGHGGFLDRLDSFLAICFSLALWNIVRLL